MYRIRLPLAALTLTLLTACQAAAPTASVTAFEPTAPALFSGDSVSDAAERGGTLFGSGN